MGENEELETGLAGLFVSGPAEQKGVAQPGLGIEGQAGLMSDETENLPQVTEASDSVADVAEVVEADVDGDLPQPEVQDVSPTGGPEGSDVHLIVFALNDEQYGISIASVDSIIRPTSITAIPRAPDFVEGVTNLRGTVLPVVDLKRRLGLQAADMTRDTRIIVAEMDGNKVGMLVDAVLEVRRVLDADIEPPSPLVSTVDTSLVIGIAKVENERLIILLDLDQVLARQ